MHSNDKKADGKIKFVFDKYRVILPIAYAAILCIIFVPIVIFGMKSLTAYVHTVQSDFQRDSYDVDVNAAMPQSSVTFGIIDSPKVDLYSCVGNVDFQSIGASSPVYYGVSRVCLREGGAIDADFNLPSQGGTTVVRGYNSTDIAKARSLNVGDTFTFTTGYGVFDYKVSELTLSNSFDSVNYTSTGAEKLIIVLDGTDEVFSDYNSNKLYIISEKISGPASEVKSNG